MNAIIPAYVCQPLRPMDPPLTVSPTLVPISPGALGPHHHRLSYGSPGSVYTLLPNPPRPNQVLWSSSSMYISSPALFLAGSSRSKCPPGLSLHRTSSATDTHRDSPLGPGVSLCTPLYPVLSVPPLRLSSSDASSLP